MTARLPEVAAAIDEVLTGSPPIEVVNRYVEASFKVGQSVRHVLAAPDGSNAVVKAVFPAKSSGEWGKGNWVNGAWAPQDVIRVEYPGGNSEDEFASFYKSIETEGHLDDIVSPPGSPERPKEVRGEHYTWEELYGAKEIQQFHGARKKLGEVRVVGEAPDKNFGSPSGMKPTGALGHGDSYAGSHQAWEYDDGSILHAASIIPWAGTFGNQDEQEPSVHYFALTPKNKTQIRKDARKKS